MIAAPPTACRPPPPAALGGDWGRTLGAGVEVLFDPPTLAARVGELGAAIAADYAGRRLCVVGVLRGSFMFYADLVRAIDLPLTCEFLGVSSYGHARSSSGQVTLTQALGRSLVGEHVLVVEDIVDTGLSMRAVMDRVADAGAASVAACTLLSKPSKLAVAVSLRYVGFQIADHFVVGYGLDDRGLLRNLPFVGVCREGG